MRKKMQIFFFKYLHFGTKARQTVFHFKIKYNLTGIQTFYFLFRRKCVNCSSMIFFSGF